MIRSSPTSHRSSPKVATCIVLMPLGLTSKKGDRRQRRHFSNSIWGSKVTKNGKLPNSGDVATIGLKTPFCSIITDRLHVAKSGDVRGDIGDDRGFCQ